MKHLTKPRRCPDPKCTLLYTNCHRDCNEDEADNKSYICTGRLYKPIKHSYMLDPYAFCIYTRAKEHIRYYTRKEDLISLYEAFEAIEKDKENKLE